MDSNMIWIAAVLIALITAFLRFMPFIFLRKGKTPNWITKLSYSLPFATMGMLVVYCLKDTSFVSLEGWLPALIACVLVVLSYIWKRNTLISILLGTLTYMVLVQAVF